MSETACVLDPTIECAQRAAIVKEYSGPTPGSMTFDSDLDAVPQGQRLAVALADQETAARRGDCSDCPLEFRLRETKVEQPRSRILGIFGVRK